MDEGVLRLTSRDLEKSEGEEQKKSSSLDLSLATLHQAENKVYTALKGVNIFSQIIPTLKRYRIESNI